MMSDDNNPYQKPEEEESSSDGGGVQASPRKRIFQSILALPAWVLSLVRKAGFGLKSTGVAYGGEVESIDDIGRPLPSPAVQKQPEVSKKN